MTCQSSTCQSLTLQQATIHELQRELQSAWRDANQAEAEAKQAMDKLTDARAYVDSLLRELEALTQETRR